MATRKFTSADSFCDAINAELKDRAGKITRKKVHEVVESIYTNLVENSPSFTGNFRKSFRVTVNKPYDGSYTFSPPIKAPELSSPPTGEERAISGAYSFEIDPSVDNIIYITNGAVAENGYEYFNNVEYTGWGTNPPYRPFSIAVTKARSEYGKEGFSINFAGGK